MANVGLAFTHAALNGVTLLPSSPFWDSFMPPNG